jgi:hypothetical protein
VAEVGATATASSTPLAGGQLLNAISISIVATIKLLGGCNRYLPNWLRWLPALEPPFEHARQPVPATA